MAISLFPIVVNRRLTGREADPGPLVGEALLKPARQAGPWLATVQSRSPLPRWANGAPRGRGPPAPICSFTNS